MISGRGGDAVSGLARAATSAFDESRWMCCLISGSAAANAYGFNPADRSSDPLIQATSSGGRGSRLGLTSVSCSTSGLSPRPGEWTTAAGGGRSQPTSWERYVTMVSASPMRQICASQP